MKNSTFFIRGYSLEEKTSYFDKVKCFQTKFIVLKHFPQEVNHKYLTKTYNFLK